MKGLWDSIINKFIKTACLETKDCDIAKRWLWDDYEIIELYMWDDCENNLRWLYDNISSQYEIRFMMFHEATWMDIRRPSYLWKWP